jgi:hypothetical protein
MSYGFGSKIPYQTIFNIQDSFVVSFIINNLIFTCGHCLPKQIDIYDKNLSLLYTSGFDNDNEGIELGIIKSNNNLILLNPFGIKLTLKKLSLNYDDNE